MFLSSDRNPRALRFRRRALFLFLIFTLGTLQTACTSKNITATIDPLWQKIALFFSRELSEQRTQTRLRLEQKALELKTTTDLPDADATEFKPHGTYGKLPEIRVDSGTGFIFPLPIGEPSKFSWSRVSKRSFKLIKILRKIDSQARMAKTSAEIHKLSSTFKALESEIALIFVWIRHLQTWIPQLKKNPHADYQKLLQALHENDSSKTEVFREKLRPQRTWTPPYLPLSLAPYRNQTIPLLIATDIQDPKFLAEIEGAIQTHWNQSPWARQEKIRFRIRWHRIPENISYRQGQQTLDEHLERFPKHQAVITTGAQSLHVRGNVLFLSPSPLTPRTLAHEVGHLMGFADCYFRTLERDGLAGYTVSEWDNPLYPDDLMCDNEWGVARAEIW